MVEKFYKDALGGRPDKDYDLQIVDPNFVNRLKMFDENLKLVFDKRIDKFRILEWAPDGSGWNILLTLEDSEGNPKPMGEWVFNILYVWRKRWEMKMEMGTERFFDQMSYDADNLFEKEKAKVDDLSDEIMKEESLTFDKASREINNLPTSDATAGYAKK